MRYHTINGQLTPVEKAMVHISDLAIQRGYGIFDFFFVKRGQPLFFEDYLDRFENSARLMELQLPVSRHDLKRQILELIEANDAPDSAIKLLLTGGYASDGFTPPAEQNLFIMGFPQKLYAPEVFEQGIKLMTYPYIRELAAAKTINYVTGIRILKNLQAANAQEVLYHDGKRVSESARSNFFIVKQDDTIVTANHDILWGITRKQILKHARQHYQVEERELFLEEVFTAKEAFLSSTTKGALAVTQIDDHTIGNGKPGNVTQHLNELYWKSVEEYVSEVVVS